MDFYDAVEFAKKIEKNALEHINFSDKIEIVKTIDLEPRDFENLVYSDLVEMDERIEKIINASRIIGEISAPQVKVEKEQKIKTQEIEIKVKNLTTESLQKAQEISKEIEKPVEEITEEPVVKTPIEDISRIDFKKPKQDDLVIEREFEKTSKPEEKKPEERLKQEIKLPKEEIEKPVVKNIEQLGEKIEIAKTIEQTKPIEEKPEISIVSVPSVLNVASADEAGQSKYKEIEDYLNRELGGTLDYERIRKKMLDLTKDLFKEKNTSARERIKLEITVLKNMLGKIKEGGKIKSKGSQSTASGYSQNMLETLQSTQITELSSIKDELQTSINNQINAIKNRFFDSIKGLPEDDQQQRESAYDKLVSDFETLSNQVPNVFDKSQEYLIQKHLTELKNLNDSLGKGDAKLGKDLQYQIDYLPEKYKREFTNIKNIIAKVIDSIKNLAANEVFEKEETEIKLTGIVYEINETDEGTLLYHLHSKDPDYYKKFERNHVSKGNALHRSKILMAKEKGLSDSAITKYFGKVEEDD